MAQIVSSYKRKYECLDREIIQNLSPWTWISYEDCKYHFWGQRGISWVYHMFLFHGIREYEFIDPINGNKELRHNPYFPIALDFNGKSRTHTISLTEDIYEGSYVMSSLETWDPTDQYFSGLRISSNNEIKIAEAILYANDIIIDRERDRICCLDSDIINNFRCLEEGIISVL